MQIFLYWVKTYENLFIVKKGQQNYLSKHQTKYFLNPSDLFSKQIQSQQLQNIMTTPEEAPKQIKQYKDFTTITNLRKVTQQSMAPIIKSLQGQMSAILGDYTQMSKKLAKMEDVLRNQTIIQDRIQQTNKIIRDFKQNQAQLKRQEQKRNSLLNSANQKLFIQMHSMRNSIQNQNQAIKQVTNKNNKTFEMYTNLNSNSDKTINDIRQKFSSFTKEAIEISKQMKQQHLKIQSQFECSRQSLRKQREDLNEKLKPLQLYMNQRQTVNQKISDLYSKIINCVVKQDYQSFRKSIKVFIENQINGIQKQINEVLPQSLRNQLPLIQKKLKQVDKIKLFQKNCEGLQIQIRNISKDLQMTQNKIKLSTQEIKQEMYNHSSNLKQLISEKINQLTRSQQQINTKLQQKLHQLKLQMQQQVLSIIEKQTSSIQKSIQQQLSNKNNNNYVPVDLSGKEEQLRQQIKQVKDISERVISRYKKIQQIGQSIDKRIQGYSSKITKIKSDYQLFSEGIRKQISGVIRFRDTFVQRLQDVGRLLSTFTEILLINTSLLLQYNQEDTREPSFLNTERLDNREPLVFITQNDGIIYDWRPDMQKGTIIYRRQMMDIKFFLRSYMYSLITFVDDQFSHLSFLNWNDHKPSSFFKERVLDNYYTIRNKNYQARNNEVINKKDKNFHRRTSFNSSNQNIIGVPEQFQKLSSHHAASTKMISKTIEQKSRLDKVLQEGSQANVIQQLNKNYCIKKAKPQSSRLKYKSKKNEASRYDQVFLTSRSACRSRINQLI